jgi:hypothetical protein
VLAVNVGVLNECASLGDQGSGAHSPVEPLTYPTIQPIRPLLVALDRGNLEPSDVCHQSALTIFGEYSSKLSSDRHDNPGRFAVFC